MFIVTTLQALLIFIPKAIIDIRIQTNYLDFVDWVLVGNVAIIVSVKTTKEKAV